jgi:hypothetical protein
LHCVLSVSEVPRLSYGSGVSTLVGRRLDGSGDGFSTLDAAYELVRFLQNLSQVFASVAAIERGLEARNLGALWPRHQRALELLHEAARIDPDLVSLIDPSHQGDPLPAVLERWPLAGSQPIPTRRLLTAWVAQRVPPVCQLLEALPVEAGENALTIAALCASRIWGPAFSLTSSDRRSGWRFLADELHQRVATLCASLGATYKPMRLYQDTLLDETPRLLLEQTQGGYAFAESATLVRELDVSHGTIVRIIRPALGTRSETTQRDEWDGVFEYASRPEPASK